MSIVFYVIIFLLAVILIETIVIIVLANILKKKNREEILITKKKQVNIKAAKKAINNKSKEYENEIKKANDFESVQRVVNRITDDIMQDFDNRD